MPFGPAEPVVGELVVGRPNTAAMDNPNLDLGSSLGNKPAPDFGCETSSASRCR